MPLNTEAGLGQGDFVLRGPSSLQRDTAPNFRPICSGQMAGWIKMPLGMEVGPSSGDFVLDGDPASPPHKEGEGPSLPNFRPMSIVTKRLDGPRWHLARRWALVHATLC